MDTALLNKMVLHGLFTLTEYKRERMYLSCDGCWRQKPNHFFMRAFVDCDMQILTYPLSPPPLPISI